jgi:hypothetical protein
VWQNSARRTPSGLGGRWLDLAERKATELGEDCARRGRGRDRGWGLFFSCADDGRDLVAPHGDALPLPHISDLSFLSADDGKFFLSAGDGKFFFGQRQ